MNVFKYVLMKLQEFFIYKPSKEEIEEHLNRVEDLINVKKGYIEVEDYPKDIAVKGRKPYTRITSKQLARIKLLHSKGKSVKFIANDTGLKYDNVYYYVNKKFK